MSAEREHGQGEIMVHDDRQRRVAPRAPQDRCLPAHDADDGIVASPGNRPVVDQEEVGDGLQGFDGVVFVRADRLVGPVAAGGNHRETEFGH